jgi:hypothetical protein
MPVCSSSNCCTFSLFVVVDWLDSTTRKRLRIEKAMVDKREWEEYKRIGQRRHNGSKNLGSAGMWRNFARRKGGVAGAFTEHTCLDTWRSMHVPTQTLHSCESQIEMPVLSTSFSTRIAINTRFSSHVTTRTFPFMTHVKGSTMFRACKFVNTS